jgi:hypothetical protein
MSDNITEAEARLALSSIETQQRQVIAQIDMPRWYWWGLALGWVTLGVITDLGRSWVTAGATLAFGAVHAAAASRVLSGRHRSPQLSVHRDLVGRHVPILVVGSLIGLTVATVILAVLADADGAGHPVTMASVVAAVVVLCGGPNLMAAVRRHTGFNGTR